MENASPWLQHIILCCQYYSFHFEPRSCSCFKDFSLDDYQLFEISVYTSLVVDTMPERKIKLSFLLLCPYFEFFSVSFKEIRGLMCFFPHLCQKCGSIGLLCHYGDVAKGFINNSYVACCLFLMWRIFFKF